MKIIITFKFEVRIKYKYKNPNDYEKQKERALTRKLEIINMKGGKCEICGYDKNISALDFHHIDPNKKEFQLDSRHLSNTTNKKITEELKKCNLLCSNCHREIHNKQFDKKNIKYLLDNFKSQHKSILHVNKTITCLKCKKEFPSVNGKIYCSDECRKNDKGYPSIQDINERYLILLSWEKVAEYFGITRRIIQRIRNQNVHIV